MRAFAGVAGVLGGACLLARLFLAGGSEDLVWIVGVGLLIVSVLVAGLLLVPRSPGWLQVIVAVGCVGLAISVVAAIRGEGDPETVDALVGGAAVPFGIVLLATRGSHSRERPRHGSHSR